MFKALIQIFKQHVPSEAETWFGRPDVVQNLTADIFFKEWIDVVENEIVQIYYHLGNEHVSVKTIPKGHHLMVNDIVPWGMEFTEKEALDHLVQINPKSFLTFHPDINNLSFTNQDLY